MPPSPRTRRPPVFSFAAQQDRSRRATAWLVIAFVALLLLFGAAVGSGSALLYAYFGESRASAFDPMIALAISGGTAVVIGLASLYQLLRLGGDGARVAESVGATEILPNASNQYHRRFLNIVQEMAIAANLPTPRAYVMQNERGINAFAAGSTPQNSVIAVTHGALSLLDRDELSGVVGHEMAHIANADTRLNGRLLAMVFGLVVLSQIGRLVLESAARSRPSSSKKGNATVILLAAGLMLLVLGALGVLAGRILQSMVSRRREYLADATGIQFTRNPDGLARALKKIGANAAGSRVAGAHAEEARHMFFANSTRSALAGLFATHPPLHDRIRAIEPGFDPATDPVWNASERGLRRSNLKGVTGPWETRAQDVEV